MSIRRWRVGLGIVLFAALSTASMAWATLLTPTPVIGGAGNQFSPSAAPAGAYIAYSANRPGHPNVYDAYVKQPGLPRVKVNTNGTAFTGGIDGNMLIYQHIRNGQSNLALYDLADQAHTTPTGVNSTSFEWGPTLSGDWILFGRENLNVRPISDRVILHNELSSVTHVLDAQVGRPDRFLSPGQVNGDFATWDRYTPSTQSGTVRRFQISTLTTVKVPLPIGKIQYASSTNPSGTIFYVRSGLACGKKVVIREDVPGVSDTALAALPAGYDIYRTFAVDEGGGVTSLYFDRFNCATGAGWNIYKLTIS